MTVAAPPRRPPRGPDPEALFDEARRHRRRRRLRLLLAALVVLAAGAGAYAAFGSGNTVFGLGDGSRSAVPPRYRAVVLLVDVSGSMRATDVAPTRLGATVKALETFLGRLPDRIQVGLVSFSTSAKVVVPPTRDHALVREGLSSLEPLSGTALGDGLDAAVKLTVQVLRRDGVRPAAGHEAPAAIVLESDGAQNRGAVTPMQAAHRAEAAGIRVDGVALGTPNGKVAFGSGLMQNSIPVPPDPKTVEQVARLTGGDAFTATSSARLAAVCRELVATIGR